MLERFTDLSKLDTFPEEVQQEIRQYEDYGRELVYVEHIQHSDEEDNYVNNYWTIVYYEPLHQTGQTSPYDVFWFASLNYTSWPKPSLMKYFYSLRRREAEMLAKHEGRKPASIEEVA
jgi:hypothetical protein